MNDQSIQLPIESGQLNESIKHKFNRIQKQEIFKISNLKYFNLLTKRELQILVLISNDFNNPKIAEMLFISRFTVEQHRKNINKKLEVKSHLQLYQYALAFNIV